jgi:hypothetical protein
MDHTDEFDGHGVWSFIHVSRADLVWRRYLSRAGICPRRWFSAGICPRRLIGAGMFGVPTYVSPSVRRLIVFAGSVAA